MKHRDEFDDPRGSGLGFLGSVGPKAAFFVVLIALSFMVGVVWKLYVGAGSGDTTQEVPIVRADDSPFKVTPDEPGGMEIPHKDSTIFSSLNEGGERIENLLADEDDEEPMPRSQLFAGLNTEEPTEGEERIVAMTEEAQEIVGEMIDDGVESVMPAAPEINEEVPAKVEVKTEPIPLDFSDPVQEVVVPKKVEPKVETIAPVEPEPAPIKKAEPKSKPEPVKKEIEIVRTSPPASGDYYVQVGSVRSAAGAESEWKKIQAKHSVLSGFSHRVESADLGAKGTFYRIQAGPVSQSAATSACNAIKKKDPNGCLVKKK